MKKILLWIVLAIACYSAKSNPTMNVSDFIRYSQQMNDLSAKYMADKQFADATKVIDKWLITYEKTSVTDKLSCQQIYASILYNQACAYAQSDELLKALKSLKEAVRMGFNNKFQLVNDGNLLPLKSFDEFKKIVKSMNS